MDDMQRKGDAQGGRERAFPAGAVRRNGPPPTAQCSTLSLSLSPFHTADAARAHELIRSFVLEGLLAKGRGAGGAGGAGAESYAE